MVIASLTLGAIVGVVLSGAFLYFEVGRYAVPQVPVTLFDERKVLFAYTAGLFVGIPLAIAFILFELSMGNGALLSALLFLGLLVIGDEVAQWAVLRTRYWGSEPARPFYATGFRAAVGGIISLALVSQYLSNPTITVDGTALVVLESMAVVALQVAGSFLSLPPSTSRERVGGSAVAGDCSAPWASSCSASATWEARRRPTSGRSWRSSARSWSTDAFARSSRACLLPPRARSRRSPKAPSRTVGPSLRRRCPTESRRAGTTERGTPASRSVAPRIPS